MSDLHEGFKAVNRRDFLRGAGVALGAAALGGAFPAHAWAADSELKVNGLPAVVLGRTGLKVTRVSFGGILVTEPSVLARVIDQGFNFIHTAPGYTNGRSMEAFGKVLKTRRKEVILALKERPENLDACLKVLNTDYVDVLVPPTHSVDAVADPSIPENFEKAKKAGKCGFMGFADHNDMTNILNKANELGYFDVALLGYSKSDDPAFLEATGKAAKKGMGLMAMKGLPKRASEQLNAEELGQVSARCAAMVNKENAHTVLASMGSFQAVDIYRDILSTKLGCLDSGAERRYWAAQEGAYCAMCGACSGVCPSGVEVSRVVRYRMYNNDYKLTDYARAQYAALDKCVDPAACASCGACEKVCTRSLPLRSMLAEAHAALS
ncbi:aldo/keto reductase [bacterium]|nr:aldo/keto reductase [bacterium]